MKLQHIHTDNAPKAVGPYSQAVKAGDLLFVSGQIPINPDTGEIIRGDTASQTKQCLKNIMAILNEAGMNASHIVKTTIYLKDMNDFTAINEIYATFFEDKFPARACVETSRLPKDAGIEIDAIACL